MARDLQDPAGRCRPPQHALRGSLAHGSCVSGAGAQTEVAGTQVQASPPTIGCQTVFQRGWSTPSPLQPGRGAGPLPAPRRLGPPSSIPVLTNLALVGRFSPRVYFVLPDNNEVKRFLTCPPAIWIFSGVTTGHGRSRGSCGVGSTGFYFLSSPWSVDIISCITSKCLCLMWLVQSWVWHPPSLPGSCPLSLATVPSGGSSAWPSFLSRRMAFRIQPDYTTLYQAVTCPWRGFKTFNTNRTQRVQEAGTFLLFHENTPKGNASLAREGARSLRSPGLLGWMLPQRRRPTSPGGDGHRVMGTPGPMHCARLGAAPAPRGAGDTVTRRRPQGTAAGQTVGSGLRLWVQIPALPVLFIWHQSPARCARHGGGPGSGGAASAEAPRGEAHTLRLPWRVIWGDVSLPTDTLETRPPGGSV